jgi:hypothetical protein
VVDTCSHQRSSRLRANENNKINEQQNREVYAKSQVFNFLGPEFLFWTGGVSFFGAALFTFFVAAPEGLPVLAAPAPAAFFAGEGAVLGLKTYFGVADAPALGASTVAAPLGVILRDTPDEVLIMSPFFFCASSMSFLATWIVCPLAVTMVVVPEFFASSSLALGILIVTPDAVVTSCDTLIYTYFFWQLSYLSVGSKS